MPKRRSLVSTAPALRRVLPSGADTTAFTGRHHRAHALGAGVIVRYRRSGLPGRWPKALVRHSADARVALVKVLGVSA
jgi:hypothetical protein